jgi:hypothetical protein
VNQFINECRDLSGSLSFSRSHFSLCFKRTHRRYHGTFKDQWNGNDYQAFGYYSQFEFVQSILE